MAVTQNESNIGKNMLKLLSGEVSGRILAILLTPIITRLYLPADFGVLAVFNSLIAVITPFGCLKYPLAIPIARNDSAMINLVSLSLIILLTITSIFTITLSIWGDSLLAACNMQEIVKYWYLIPISFICIGIYEILSNICIRDKKFTIFATTSVLQKAIGAGVKILFGYIHIRPTGLLLGDIISQSGGVTILTRNILKRYKFRRTVISRKRICLVAQRYNMFPRYRVPSQVFLALSGSLPILYFAWQFSSTVVGEIGLARTMLSIPVTFVGASIGKAFYGEIAKTKVKDIRFLSSLTYKIIKKLFLLSIIPFAILIIAGPEIFSIVFGAEWYEAGKYARIMSIFLIFQFVYSPISEGVFNVCKKQKSLFLLEFSRILLILISLGTSYFLDLSSMNTILVYSMALAIQYIISLIVVLNIINHE